jgi:hypothetical protein
LENLKYNSKLAKDLSELINKYEVTLGILDLGCSGGPDEIFSELNYSGIVVNYHGYDFNDEEIERLSKKYPSNFNFHSYKIVTEEPSEIDQKWWSSFSAGEASAEAQISEFSKKEIIDNNFWNSDLVNKSKEEINLTQILISTESNFDLLKIDLDGPDFSYLQDFFNNTKYLPQFVSLEVSYQGSESSKSNTFHNTDRFMKGLGYDLMAITNRTYSSKVLPSRFQYSIFAQTIRGIPYQGDALYYKSRGNQKVNEILREIILLDAFKLEDRAAIVVLENREIIGERESTFILNLLTREVWGETFQNYESLMDKWRNDKRYFFPETSKTHSESVGDLGQLRIKEIVKILLFKLVKKVARSGTFYSLYKGFKKILSQRMPSRKC